MTVALMLATIGTGLIAGLFYTYSCSVMLGLRRVDDRTFIETMQHINREIQNGVFALAFFGAALAGVVAVVIDITNGGGVDLAVIAGVALYLLSLIITFRVNIPLNIRLEQAGRVDRIADPKGVREAFEGPWVRWNHIRTLISTAGFAFLCYALLG